MNTLRIGVSRTDITPPVGTAMEGYIERRGVSQGVHDRLFARAMVILDRADTKVAVISLDLIGVGKWLVDATRKQISAKTGIMSNNIMIAATHTHSGPRGVVDFFTGEDAFSKGLFDRALCERISNSVVEATASADSKLLKARIGLGRTVTKNLFSNRRSPEGPFDPEIEVMRTDFASDAHLIGCLANFGCHPTVLGPDNLLFSPDFLSYMIDTIQLSTKSKGGGGEVLFLNGAAGNVSTRFTRKAANFAEAERIGRALGSEVAKAIKGVKRIEEDIEITTISEVIRLPQRKLPSVDFVRENLRQGEQLLKQLQTSGAGNGDIRRVESMTEGARGLLAAYDYASKFEGRNFEVEIQVFKFGDTVTICACPGELFAELGLEVKKRLMPSNAMIVGYANGFIGYVLPEESYQEGGYESLSTLLEPKAGRTIVETIERLANNL